MERQAEVSPTEPLGSLTEPCHADRLPAELLQLVLSQLQLPQLLQVQRVSRRWRDAVLDLLRRRQELELDHVDFQYLECSVATLRHLLRLMPALRVLGLDGGSDSTITTIATHCKHLVNIDLNYIAVTDDSVRKLCNACPALEAVKGCCFNDSSLCVLLSHLPALRDLDLSGSDVTGQCFSMLPGSLERLSVSGCQKLRPHSLRQVGKRCSQLRQLNVSWLHQLRADDLAAALESCPQLERLAAENMRQPPERCLPPAGLPALKYLAVHGVDFVTDTTLQRLPDLLPSLQTLNIRGCEAVTNEGLHHLRRCGQLFSLNLTRLRRLTDAGLGQLHGMQLKELFLGNACSRVNFTDEGVSRLVVACPSLRQLHTGFEGKLTPRLVDLLLRDLADSRDLTLRVFTGNLEQLRRKLPPLPSSGPLRLVFGDTATKPYW